MMRDPVSTIGNLVNKQSICFLGSIDAEGFPNVKAMLKPCTREGIKTFWFHTNMSSLRAAQYQANDKACLYFCDERFFRGVMLRGKAEVLTDQSIKDRLWQADYIKYYSQGATDPDYCVFKFTAFSGRYYSNFSSEDFEIK